MTADCQFEAGHTIFFQTVQRKLSEELIDMIEVMMALELLRVLFKNHFV